ncbi:PREDICTED: SAFB-like transcription modulator isoform X1 [Amphimedon queenslandica]|uniref:RRM domain-containing protein n=2 Tax=Amphimedon queenslandica TaxID=400682 RepID=A0AAN0IAJ0_AMPQE|nr:PREDICTED: SAFB-like transcription modulator isoform X1 [Amphimedon queenslandica]|eukprot:XP_003384025.2 PREDICTED: SAFB-like transcription modulator isoform X1 [Amphimedon queenslandica]
MAELFLRGKKVSELKLVEIKEELVKRNLPKRGNKALILKRLEKALLTEKLHAVSPDSNELLSSNMDKGSEFCATSPEVESKANADQIFGGDPLVDPCHDSVNEEEQNMSAAASESLISAKVDSQSVDLLLHEGTTLSNEVKEAREIIVADVKDVEGHVKVDEQKLRKEGNEFESSETNAEPGTDVKILNNTNICASTSAIGDSPGPESIDPSYPKEEELIYEGDVDHEERVDDEDKDVLIVDVNSKELDLGVANDKVKSSVPTCSDGKVQNRKPQSADGESSSSCNLWVSSLAPHVSAADLKSFFSCCGQVESVKVVARASNKGERFAFIVMGSHSQAKKAVEDLNGKELKGKSIHVEIKKSSPFSGKEKVKQKIVKSVEAVDVDVNKDSTSLGISHRTAILSKKSGDSGIEKDLDLSNGNEKSSHKPLLEKTVGNRKDSSNSKRIVSVERQDGRKELFTTHRKADGRPRSRSPHNRRPSSTRGRVVSHRLSPARDINVSPRQRFISPPRPRHSPPRHYDVPPRSRRLSPDARRSSQSSRRLSPPLRCVSPPSHQSLPPYQIHLRSPSYHSSNRRLASSPPLSSVRSSPMFIMESRMHHRLGSQIIDSQDLHLRFRDERDHVISDREREALRRDVEFRQSRKEQELYRQMRELQERESHGRDVLERQQKELQELQKTFREREACLEAKERELKAREVRERDRLSAIERQKEKEIREKVQREFQRSMEEREERQKKVMEEHLRVHQKLMLEKEKKLKEQEERLASYKEEMNRRQKEEEEIKERERNENERKERDNRNRGAAIKRSYNEEYPALSKRQAVDDPSVFGRLGGRDSQVVAHSNHSSIGHVGSSQQGQSRPVVKEAVLANNVTYRRFESPKSGNRLSATNPYSQSQSRSNKVPDHQFNSSSNKRYPPSMPESVTYPPPMRFSGQHYRGDSSNVGYGGTAGGTEISSLPFSTGNPKITDAVPPLIDRGQDYLLSHVLNNVKRSGPPVHHQPVPPPITSYPRRIELPYHPNLRGSGFK